MVFLIMLFWYIILHQEVTMLSEPLKIIPKEMCPLVVWIIFVVYYLFPIKLCNYKGRIFVLKLLKDVFSTLINFQQEVFFRVSWATDQMSSFAIPIQDLQYTWCYYYNMWQGEDKYHCHQKNFVRNVILVSIPLLLR